MDARDAVILLVEDEVLIRMAAADLLQDRGFTVIEAGDAEEALRLLAEVGRVDLLFTDVNLSDGLDGVRLARLVHERSPGTRLVVTSGAQHLHDIQLPGSAVFVPKPYRGDHLCEVFRTQLARGA